MVSTDGMFGVKEKETSVNISGLARKPRKRRIKVKIRPWCVSFSGYILISPEREMECTQLFCCSRMDNTMSKLVKLCQMVLNSVAALYIWN